MSEIQKIISKACLQFSDSGESSKDLQARKIIKALQDGGYDIFEMSKEQPQFKEGIKEVSEEEIWDECSEYLEDDIDSLQRFAGTTIMTKNGFKKALSLSKEQGSEWISVKDRLPDNNNHILLSDSDGYVSYGFYDINENSIVPDDGEEDHTGFIDSNDLDEDGRASEAKNITHWMPLPKAPQI